MAQLEQVSIVASTRGHLRIDVPRLYQSAPIKAELERTLSAHPAVIDTRANPLTGRVLIMFRPDLEAGILLADLGFSVRPPKDRPSRPSPEQPKAPNGSANGMAKAGAATQEKAANKPAAGTSRSALYAPWHGRHLDEALAFFDSSPQRGLSADEAAKRLQQGYNTIPTPPPVSSLEIFVNQFKSLPIILLGVSAGVSLLTGGVAEAAAIGAVLVLNGAIGFSTERKAESTVASLSELIDDIVMVLRDGAPQQIAASNVVPGDILVLRPGSRLAADVRLVETTDLLVDESALTGESFPVAKDTEPLAGKPPLAERRNMAYRGTAVSMGSGTGLVVGTGTHTEAGAIQAMTSGTQRPKTAGQIQLDHLGKQLIKGSSAMCVVIFGIGLLRGYDRLSMFKTAISLAIAAVPEGLPAVATTSLARGIKRMRDKNVLMRHLHAVEAIGSIQTICLDKTGTLTMNQMSAVAIKTVERDIDPCSVNAELGEQMPELARLVQICVLCNQSESDGKLPDSPLQGSATENALIELAARAGLSVAPPRLQFPLVDTELRAEGRNFMRTVHRVHSAHSADASGEQLVAVKGSPDEVLALCAHYIGSEGTLPLSEQVRERVMQQNQDMAAQQLRVLGFAFAQAGSGQAMQAPLTWVGLVGLADPLRPGVEQVIARFHQAGIATIMLTGDQAATAAEIGKQLHLNNGDELNVVNSEQLDDIEPGALRDLATRAHVFSRVTPSDKLRIVQALQQAGRTVAMTGDGINDSPALRAADVGIAMGGGTDVALSAADIALKNDELGTLLDAVSQGRTISTNIRKSVHFLLSSNLSDILVVAGSVTAGLGQPLTPLQLLWLNLLTDMLPAIALASEEAEPDVMQRPPRDPAKPIVDPEDMWRYVREGGALAVGTLFSYGYGVMRYGPGARSSTIAFDTLVAGQMLHALFCRSEQRPTFFDSQAPKNRQLMLAIASSLGLQVAGHLVPGLRRLLGIAPLGLVDIGAIVAGAVGSFVVNELGKASSQSKAAADDAASRRQAGVQSKTASNAMAEGSTSLSASLSANLSTNRPAMPDGFPETRHAAAGPV